MHTAVQDAEHENQRAGDTGEHFQLVVWLPRHARNARMLHGCDPFRFPHSAPVRARQTPQLSPQVRGGALVESAISCLALASGRPLNMLAGKNTNQARSSGADAEGTLPKYPASFSI